MGNTVTCCVSPDASPKLSRARGSGGAAAGPDRWVDAYQAAAAGGGLGSAEAESADSDPGSGGPHLQHISDREFPDGERRGRRSAGSAAHHIPALPTALSLVALLRCGWVPGGGGLAAQGAAPPRSRRAPFVPAAGSLRSSEPLGDCGAGSADPAPRRAPSKVPRGCHRADTAGVPCGRSALLPPHGGISSPARDLFTKYKT